MMTTVKMLKQTRYNDKPVHVGDEVLVDDKTARRWAAKKSPICELISSQPEMFIETEKGISGSIVPESEMKSKQKKNANTK